jgi:hypothetical protein
MTPILPRQSRLSMGTSGRDESQLFRCKRPINRAFGFCHGLRFNRGLAPYGCACVERDRPFPHLPPDALNQSELYITISHRSPRFLCSESGFALRSAARIARLASLTRCRSPFFQAAKMTIAASRWTSTKLSACQCGRGNSLQCLGPRPLHYQNRRSATDTLDTPNNVIPA